jgi:hypothetical protein
MTARSFATRTLAPRPLAAAFALFISVVLSSALPPSALAEETVKPSGKVVSEKRDTKGFSGVALGMSGEVELRQGNVESVTVTADDNILPFIETVVERGSLQIRWKRDGRRVQSHNRKIRIVVEAINVESLAVGGSGRIVASTLKSSTLSGSVGGSGEIRVDRLDAQTVSADVGGSGRLLLAGRTDTLKAVSGGSGQLQLGDLVARTATVSTSGSGRTVVAARESLSVAAAGSGSVGYYGDPITKIAKAGSGSVSRQGSLPL